MDIGALLRELGIEYREMGTGKGAEALARCPAHDDRHPSWSCNLRTGVHHCFSCGFSGNLAHLVHYITGQGYTESVLWVNSRIGWAKSHAWREDIEEASVAPRIFAVSEKDLGRFTEPPEDAIASRNITSQSARDFEVMWNPDHKSWIFPVRDPYEDSLWGWQEKLEHYYRNYPPGTKRSRTLFGLGIAPHGSTVVLVESPLDCVRISVAGCSGAVSSYGVSTSDFQLSLILGRASRIVLALDNDRAGIAETERILREYPAIAGVTRVFDYGESPAKDPGGMTDDEIRYGIEHAKSGLRRAADNNQWLAAANCDFS